MPFLAGPAALMMKGDYSATEKAFRETIEMHKKIFGETHWKVRTTESTLGECLIHLGHYEHAEILLLNSYQTIKNHFSAENKRTRKAVERIITLYKMWNRIDKVSEYEALLTK